MKNSKKPRTNRTIRFSDEEEERIDRAAESDQRSFSDFVRIAALEKAEAERNRQKAEAHA